MNYCPQLIRSRHIRLGLSPISDAIANCYVFAFSERFMSLDLGDVAELWWLVLLLNPDTRAPPSSWSSWPFPRVSVETAADATRSSRFADSDRSTRPGSHRFVVLPHNFLFFYRSSSALSSSSSPPGPRDIIIIQKRKKKKKFVSVRFQAAGSPREVSNRPPPAPIRRPLALRPSLRGSARPTEMVEPEQRPLLEVRRSIDTCLVLFDEARVSSLSAPCTDHFKFRSKEIIGVNY